MSLKIYLDDCAYDKELVRCLEQAGHAVVTPAQAGIRSVANLVNAGITLPGTVQVLNAWRY